MAATIIQSDSRIDIESPFCVKAGPGAGKTHWLVEHVRNVLANSKRLEHIRKIACITYTNIGVETIQERLSVSADRVEVMTIHSFLYENVVGPYFYFIAADEGFELKKLRVVDDTVLNSKGAINEIIGNAGKHYLYGYEDDLSEAIGKARWIQTPSGLMFQPGHKYKAGKYYITQEVYNEYKKYAWEKGVMHYDDVLYFAYKLIEKHPFIAQVVGSKYPYIFIDEFQDSTPLQVEILKKIANSSNSVIGVIGDAAQAIYKFAGADPKLLDDFKLPNMESYAIQGNRRSSKEIIDFLNVIRTDLPQFPIVERRTAKPILYVGDRMAAYEEFKKECAGEITTLSYANVTSNAFRKQIGTLVDESDLLKSIDDSSQERLRALKDCITAVELAREGAMKDALKSIGKQMGKDQRKCIVALKKLVAGYADYQDKETTVFINMLIADLGLSIPKPTRGAAKVLYDKTPYQRFAVCINSPDVTHTKDKTIHKAKGDEYDNVMVILEDNAKSMDFLLDPDLIGSKEDYQRVYYVACSRARNRLAISVPKLSVGAEEKLKNIPMEVKTV